MDCNKMKGAVTEEKIVAELRATATYLAAVSGTRIFEQNRNGFEKARTNRIRFLLNKLEINATSAANVVNAIRACASMSNEAKDSMIVMVHEKLFAPEGAPSVPLKGGAQQDFRSIVNFMTAAAWESDEFEDEMIIVACSLGLVNPNEDTCAIMTAAAEAQEKGLKKAKEMKFVPLYEHLQNIKRKIKEHAAAMDQGGTLKHLPPTPDKLLLDAPDIYHRVFRQGTITPVPMPLDKHSFDSWANTLPRRSTHAGYQAEKKATALTAMGCLQAPPTYGMHDFMKQQMEMQMKMQMQVQQLMQQHQKQMQGQDDDDLIPGLTFNTNLLGRRNSDRANPDASANRSQLSLEDGPRPQNSLHRSPSQRSGSLEMPATDQRSGSLERPATEKASGTSDLHAFPAKPPRKNEMKRRSVTEATDILLNGLTKKQRKGKTVKDESSDDDSSDEGSDDEPLNVLPTSKAPRKGKGEHGKKVKKAKKGNGKDKPKREKRDARAEPPMGKTYKIQVERTRGNLRIRCNDGTSFGMKFTDYENSEKKTMKAAKKWVAANEGK